MTRFRKRVSYWSRILPWKQEPRVTRSLFPIGQKGRGAGVRRLKRIEEENKRKYAAKITCIYTFLVRNSINRRIRCCLVECSSSWRVYLVRNLSHSSFVCCSIAIGRLAPAYSLVIGRKATPPEVQRRHAHPPLHMLFLQKHDSMPKTITLCYTFVFRPIFIFITANESYLLFINYKNVFQNSFNQHTACQSCKMVAIIIPISGMTFDKGQCMDVNSKKLVDYNRLIQQNYI